MTSSNSSQIMEDEIKSTPKRRVRRRTATTEPQASKKKKSDSFEEYTPTRKTRGRKPKIEVEVDEDPDYVAEESEGSTDADEEGEDDVIEEFEEDELLQLQRESNLNSEKDIYNFDSQSLLSNSKFNKHKGSKLAKTTRSKASKQGQSYGSNIYSVLATSLKTRTDLDYYTNFLKSPHLNSAFDLEIAELCKPSVQQCSLFYGSSASMQSLLSRINDADLVVEMLRTFMRWNVDELSNKPVIMLPRVHQPLFNTLLSSDFGNLYSNATGSNVAITPCYLIDPRNSCFTNPLKEEVIYTAYHLSFLNISAMPGRFSIYLDQIVIPSETYDVLFERVSSSSDEIRAYAESSDSDLPSGTPDLTRVHIMLDSNGNFLGMCLTDVCEKSELPVERERAACNFIKTSYINEKSDGCGYLDMSEVNAEDLVQPNLNIGSESIHVIDGVISSLNSKPHLFMMVGFSETATPPFPKNGPFIKKIYSAVLINEDHVSHKANGVQYEQVVDADGRFRADPRTLNQEKGLLVLPDLLFHSIRKVATRELVSTSGASLTTVLVAAHTESGRNRTKYMILDKDTNYLIGVAIELPVTLNLKKVDEKNMIIIPGKASEEYLKKQSTTKLDEDVIIEQLNVVIINGILYAIKIDSVNMIIEKATELLPASYEFIYPSETGICHTGLDATYTSKSCRTILQVYNDETKSSTCVPAIYYPNREKVPTHDNVVYFCDKMFDIMSNLPVKISLYDAVLRLALKVTPKVLARQHRLTAEENAPDDSKPFVLPAYWSICAFCLKEFRSVNGLFIHELRHFNCGKYRCDKHGICFQDVAAMRSHMRKEHDEQESQINEDEDSDPDDEENQVKKDKPTEDDHLSTVLAHVFSTKIIAGMSSIQCENCNDYFPSADILARHLPVCDNISFFIRTPFPRVAETTVVKKEPSANEEESLPNPGWCVCGLCGYQVPSVESIAMHFVESHLKCRVCESNHRSLEELSNHYVTHIESADPALLLPQDKNDGATDDFGSRLRSIMSCEICNDFHATQLNFYYHQWAEHGVVHPPLNHTAIESNEPLPAPPKPDRKHVRVKCKFCDEELRVSGTDYTDHLFNEHDVRAEPNTVCKICFETTGTVEEMSDHIGTEHALSGEYANCGIQTVFSCMHCVFFAFHNTMIFHYKHVHGESRPAMFECMHCHERFKDRCVWQKHIVSHTESYNFACRECDRTFRLRQSLICHIQNHHPDEQKGPTKCEYCGLIYPKPILLRHHIRMVHSNQLPFNCLECHRRFRSEPELMRHKKESHGGAVRCEVCNKMCGNLKNYAFHRKKHFRVRIYQCNDCNASFKSKVAMKRHIRVVHLHLGPERFECQICGKVVTQIGMHMLTHKGSRFECEFCGKGFTKSAYYNEHLRIHRGELPFECHICKKKFNKKSNLNVHLKFHEKHRDSEGNYLELRPRGRISMIFGDAFLTPEQRQARQNASLFVVPPTDHVGVGPDVPGAFNVGGEAWCAAEACKTITGIDFKSASDECILKRNESKEKTGDDHLDKFDALRLQPISKKSSTTHINGQKEN